MSKPTMLPIPVYHGTSTIFLDGIVRWGLGGRNPLGDLKFFDFVKDLFPLVEHHLSNDPDWMSRAQTFSYMTEQRTGRVNFQHGDTYVSPSKATAIRYAANKRYGSELITYSLDFLQELLRRKIPGVADALYQRYPHVFGLLDISCSPLLIKISGLGPLDLLTENGRDAAVSIQEVLNILTEPNNDAQVLLQQTNFRLRRPVPLSQLSIRLVNIAHWNPVLPEYTLYELRPSQQDTNGPHPLPERR